MLNDRYDTPFRATVAGLLEQFRSKAERVPPLRTDERLDGRTVMVTGSNTGLGKAIAIQLAQRGAHVIMACRSGFPEAGEEVKRASGNPNVEMVRVHLDDLVSVESLCDGLRDRGVKLDRLVINAAVMPLDSRRTAQGFELMFGVNFLANVLLLDRLLADGVLPRDGAPGGGHARVVVVSSEAHRTAPPLDFDHLGDFVSFGPAGGIGQYGHTKLCLCTYATELARRLRRDDAIEIGVHAACPGAVNTQLAREAPWWMRPVLAPVMRYFFRDPKLAAEPIVYLVTAKDLEEQTSIYMHMAQRKEPAPNARDAESGRRLWERSHALVEKALRATTG